MTWKVLFQYFTESEDGCDTFSFGSEESATNKFSELSEIIGEHFAGCTNAEIIDEPDFYGIIDHSTGYWAKVVIDNKQ